MNENLHQKKRFENYYEASEVSPPAGRGDKV